ncbi:MAG: hypothetical protein D3904_07155, partial [Candidatus Electrothrix sp. EH2]|nr:hypothetical protein [Candidatus Electrothrix sp. EH2]
IWLRKRNRAKKICGADFGGNYGIFEGIRDILTSCLKISGRHLFRFPVSSNDSIESFGMYIAGRMRCTKNENSAARLNCIRAELQRTSEAWINCIFPVMNLMVLLGNLQEQLENLYLSRFLFLRGRLNHIIARFSAFFEQMPRQVLQYCLYERSAF